MQILIRRMDDVADMLIHFSAIKVRRCGENCKHRYKKKKYFVAFRARGCVGMNRLLGHRLTVGRSIWIHLTVVGKLSRTIPLFLLHN